MPQTQGTELLRLHPGNQAALRLRQRGVPELVQDAGLAAQPGAGRPRIHDLRHGFATASVQDFHRSGADPQGKLPVLSAYLGHADPAYTYIYLHACPELLGLAAQRLERFEEGRR